jgi:hypothetical protein
VASRLLAAGIRMPAAAPDGVVTFSVNETWVRLPAAEILRAFERALA